MMEWISSGAHYVLSFAVVISVIVFIHEFGHFLAARLCGVKVEVFSIGFGREIIGRTDRHGTRWKLAMWPLGGYVKMFGDAGAASTPKHEALHRMTAAERRVSFHHKPLWQKAIVVAAGPISNFILAIAVFTYFIFTVGLSSTQPIVGSVVDDSPALEAGLEPGDRIISIDGKRVSTFNEIPAMLATNLGSKVALMVERDERQFPLTLVPASLTEKDVLGNDTKRPMIGIRSEQLTYDKVGLPMAVWAATQKTYDMCATTMKLLGQMVRGDRGVEDLKGPLGIAKLSGDVTRQGDSTSDTALLLLWFIALLSVNLGMVNLFPIPMLDGGHLLFYCIEALQGRPLAERVQELSFRFGFALIAGLMALTLVNDMRQLFT